MNNNCRRLGEADAPTPCQSGPLREETCSLRTHHSASVSFYSFSSLTICGITIHLLLVCFWVKQDVLIIGRLHAKISIGGCLLRVQVAGARAGTSQAATGASKPLGDHDEHHIEGMKPSDEVKQQTTSRA